MATPDEIATTYQRQQKSVILAAIAAVIALWRRLNQERIAQSWAEGTGATLVETVAQAQLVAAAAAPLYLEELAVAQGVLADMGGLVPSALSGIASDGRSLESLMYQPVVLFRRLLAGGQRPEEAMEQAGNFMALIASTQVADAGRGAVNVGITATRAWVTYVRVVNLPACSRCIILAGKEYSWSTGFERHPNCFPAGTTVSGPAAQAATRRWYEGELAIITTASGQELSATGNHPILTDRGWVPANLLQPGDYVVRSLLSEGAVPLVVPDERQMPARIEDLWRPDGVGRLVRMPTASQDFHSDGGHGDVDVVFADGLLRDRVEPAHVQPVDHLLFGGARASANPFASESPIAAPLVGDWNAANRIMGGSGLGGSLFGSHFGGPNLTGFGSSANFDARFGKASADDLALGVVALAEAVLALAAQVCGHDRLGRNVGSLPPRWDAPRSASTPEDRGAYASRGTDLGRRLAGQVELDRVVDLRRAAWSGHVYNLTSSEGWYAANSIIVSNCDCTMRPIGPDSDTSSILAPDELFAAMSQADQDRRFGKAGAEALRLGGDMGQIVNARRGMQTAGGRLVTTEGTTRRGVAGRRMGSDSRRRSAVRPMPEQIFADANGDRDIAIQLLERNGFLDASSTRRFAAAQGRAMQASPPNPMN